MRLEIISEHNELPPGCRSFAFGQTGGTIGRGLDNDWILPDPKRFISNHHARIECIDGRFYVVDTSTNGIFLNQSRKPLGQGGQQKLSNGDILRLGNFAIHVYIDETIEPPLMESSATWSVKHGESTTAKRPPVQLRVVDSNNVTSFMQKTAPQAAATASQPAATASQPVETVLPSEMTSGATSSLSKPVRIQFSEQVLQERIRLLGAFFEGLGIDTEDTDFDQDPAKFLKQSGELLAVFIASTMRMLGGRASIKGHFRLDQTTMLPQRNNPLKMTDDRKKASRQLLGQTSRDFLAPVEAVEEAMRDLDQHTRAIIAGMQVAFDAYIGELDPDELEAGFDASLGRTGLLKKVNGMQYWNMYKDLYPVFAGRSPGHFPEAFVQEFVKGYETYLTEHEPLQVKPPLANK